MRRVLLKPSQNEIKFAAETKLHDWLRKLSKSSNVVVGIGHDAGVVKSLNGNVALKVDQVVEGVHFTKTTPAFVVGQKALLRALSDCAAIGASPRYALLSLAVSPNWNHSRLITLFNGLIKTAKTYGVELVGGDLSRTSGSMVASVSVIGELQNRKPSQRSKAKPNDRIFVTGTLGGSILGKHLSFVPKIKEGIRLTQYYKLGAMMDISDGLSIDLWRLCQSSGVGAVLDVSKIPISTAAKRLAKHSKKTALQHALEDGEDYELLFTLPASQALKLYKDSFFKKNKVWEIGRILPQKKLLLKNSQGKLETLKIKGYAHRW